jgi:hypothetical protein
MTGSLSKTRPFKRATESSLSCHSKWVFVCWVRGYSPYLPCVRETGACAMVAEDELELGDAHKNKVGDSALKIVGHEERWQRRLCPRVHPLHKLALCSIGSSLNLSYFE